MYRKAFLAQHGYVSQHSLKPVVVSAENQIIEDAVLILEQLPIAEKESLPLQQEGAAQIIP